MQIETNRHSLYTVGCIKKMIKFVADLTKEYSDTDTKLFLNACKYGLEANLAKKKEVPTKFVDMELAKKIIDLGFTDEQAKVFTLILQNPKGLPVSDIYPTLEMGRGKVYRILQTGVEIGIITVLPDTPSRYTMLEGVKTLKKIVQNVGDEYHRKFQIVTELTEKYKELTVNAM